MCTCANLARGESLYVQSDRIVWAHSDRSVTVWLYLALGRLAVHVSCMWILQYVWRVTVVTRSERGLPVELSRACGALAAVNTV